MRATPDRPLGQKLWQISRTGLTAVLLHPLRSIVTILVLLAVLAPYTAGLGISQALLQQLSDSIQLGADLYVTSIQFGRQVPVPTSVIPEIESFDGVAMVIPQIVGRTQIGKEALPVIIVGLPVSSLPTSASCVDGRLFTQTSLHELVVGTELAEQLKLTVGSMVPPFYENDLGERNSKVVGIFKSSLPHWQSRLIFTSLENASQIFNQHMMVTSLLVYCHTGYTESLKNNITQLNTKRDDFHLKVTTQYELKSQLPLGLWFRDGNFQLQYLLMFLSGILVFLVTSGFGLSDRRREIGILKATGWQTDEILLRSFVESATLAFLGASISLLVAFVWLHWFNGYWVATVFIGGNGLSPTFQVPSRLTPIPAFLCFIVSFVLILSGTLYSSWRAAIVSPTEAMK